MIVDMKDKHNPMSRNGTGCNCEPVGSIVWRHEHTMVRVIRIPNVESDVIVEDDVVGADDVRGQQGEESDGS